MSIHKVAAGHGYTYLTRQVAANDLSTRGSGSLASYYAEKGESPGIWLGNGITAATWNESANGLGGVSVLRLGNEVTEAQMVALFGEGRHPNADAIETALTQDGVRGRSLERATLLGQRFPSHPETNVFRERLAAAYRSHNTALGSPSGAPIGDADRAGLRTELASRMFTETYSRPPLDGPELSAYMARVSRPPVVAVAGYDLTFSPVKSVSTLWAIAPIEIAEVIAGAHQDAVRDAIGWLEGSAAFTRRGAGGVAQVETRGFLAAAFTHRDSRAGDPDLHTHVAVSNKVQTLDGHWLALDGRALYKNKVAASERYNTRLEALLVQRLGVRFAERPSPAERQPVREIIGVRGPLTDAWSTRRYAITAETSRLAAKFQVDHGRTPTPAETRELAQVATLSTREGKHEPRSHAEQRTTWRAEAVHVLGSERVLEEVVRASIGHLLLSPEPSSVPAAEDIDAAAEHVLEVIAEQRATWQPHHVRAEAERHARATGISFDHLDGYVNAVVSTALSPEHSVALNPPRPISEPSVLRRSDGTSVYEVSGSRRYTNKRILAAERAVLELAARSDGHAISLPQVGLALIESEANGMRLGPDQRAMVRTLATSGARVQLALAPAGTGKTVALRTLARAWTAAGGTVIGLAPSAAAAAVLGQELDGSAVATDTLAKLVHATRTGSAVPDWVTHIDAQTLILLDEAGMASTLDLAQLCHIAVARGASVRLVGDDRQLTAVGAGGLLRDISRTHGAVTLTETRRFQHEDGTPNRGEAAAALALRAGDPDAIAYYTDHDRIHPGTSQTVLDEAYAAWAADRAAGKDSVLLAPTRDLVAKLNQKARTDRLASFQDSPNQAEVLLVDGTCASSGDAIITRRNDRTLTLSPTNWVANGDRWTVTHVHPNGSLDAQHARIKRSVTLPAAYVAEHVSLGYATTVHTSQGLTADTSHTIATGGETGALLYVALTRGRTANHVYLDTSSPVDTNPYDPDALRPRTPTEDLQRVLEHDEQAVSAITEVEQLRDPVVLLGEATAEYADALANAATHISGPEGVASIDAASEELFPGITDQLAWPALQVRLLCMQLDGQKAYEALRFTRSSIPQPAQDVAAQKAAEVHRWYERHAAGPAPWLPAVPVQIAEHPDWGPYLRQHIQLLEERTRAVAQEAATWTPETAPPWASTTLIRDPHLTRDLAVWRAAHAIPDSDSRPTGPTARELDALKPQLRLQHRVDAVVDPGKAAAVTADKIDVRLRRDTGWPALATAIRNAQQQGLTEADIIRAATSRPLPADQPAAALRWRLADLAVPAQPCDDTNLTPSGRWAALAESINPGVTGDADWEGLADTLDRASQQGIDLRTELPRVAASLDRRSQHPARSLDLAISASSPSTLVAHRQFEAETNDALSQELGIDNAIPRPAPRR